MGEKGALGHVKPVNLKCHCFSDFIVAIAFTDVSKEYLPPLNHASHPLLCVFTKLLAVLAGHFYQFESGIQAENLVNLKLCVEAKCWIWIFMLT